ncbi:MAG: cell division protein FtsQ/DivIB [Nocardioidaceae bacterium]
MSGAQDQARSRFRRRRWRSRVGRVLPYLIGLGVVAAIAGIGWLVFASSVLGVHDVQVDGVRSIGADRVREQAQIAEGSPLATLDTDAIAERIEQLPRVADAAVHRRWPRGVTLEVTERTTVAVVADSDGIRGVDATGVEFRGYDTRPDDVPRITLGADIGDDREQALAEAAHVIEALDDSIAERVHHIEVGSADSIDLLLGNGDRVRWGSAVDSDRKSEVLLALLDVPAGVYDVSAPEHPATSPE